MAKLHWLKDARRLSISLTIVAALLYAYSLTQARFEIGYFGSIHSLPLTFFVALSLLTIASAILWVSPQPHGKLLGLQLGLFILALHLTMLAIGGVGVAQSGTTHLYSEVGLSEYIFRTGHFSPPPSDLWRLNWPAAIVLNAIIMLVSGTADANMMIALNIFIWLLLTTSLVYLFLRSTIGKDNVNHCLAGTWLFLVANWFIYYLLASVIGYFLLLVVMVLLAKSLLQERQGNSFAYRLCLIIVLVVLPATHLLTALVVLIMLLAVYAIRRSQVLGLTMILAFIIAAWSIYATVDFLNGRLTLFIEQIKMAFRLDILWNLGVVERIVGSEAHQAVNTLRVLASTLFSVIGVTGGITMLKDRKITNNDKFVLATTIGMVATLLIISAAYKWEMIQRSYLFMLPAIAYFGVKLLKHKITAIILTVLLVVALPLHFVYIYGNAFVDYVSPQDISGVYFFHEYTDEGYFTGALVHFPLGTMENRENYHFAFLDRPRWENNQIHSPIGYPFYIYLRPDDQEIYEFLGAGDDEHINDYTKSKLSEIMRRIDSATNTNLIYTNPGLSIYVARPPQLER